MEPRNRNKKHLEETKVVGLRIRKSRVQELDDLNIVSETSIFSEFSSINQYVNHLISMDLIERTKL